MFENQNIPQDQVQAWIALNPQFAQAVAQAMTPAPAMRYQPTSQNNQNWLGRNVVPTTQTSAPSPRLMPGLHGKIISSPNDIKPNEVSMDGTASLFPMADDSCIYAKAWMPDGTIQTIRYIPEKTAEQVQNQGPSEFDQVMTRLDKIEQMLGQRYQNQKQQYYNRNSQRNHDHAVDSQVNAKDYNTVVNRTEAN